MDAGKLKYNIDVVQDIYGNYTINIPLYMIDDKKCEIKIVSKEVKE